MKKENQGSVVTTIATVMLFVALVAYFVFATADSMFQPFTTISTYPYTLDDVTEVTGYVVREERELAGSSDIMDVVPAEGEKVAKGETIAYIYQDSEALDRKREVANLTMELEQYEYALSGTGTGWDNTRLDQAISEAAVQLKVSTEKGDLTGLEEQSKLLKSLIIRREFTYNGGTEEVQRLIADTRTKLTAIQSNSYLDTTLVRTNQSGYFSSLVDGYETQWTPTHVRGLTPSKFDALVDYQPAEVEDVIGKLVTDDTWRFACVVDQGVAQRMNIGGTVTVRFSRDWSGTVAMKVEEMSTANEGRVAVVLSSDRYIGQVTLLRKQTVEFVFDSTAGVRVPKMALRSVILNEFDPETQVETQRQVSGVYVVMGVQAEFKEVEVIADDGDYYLLRAVDESKRNALRAGDEVIVAAVDLYDGKVIA